MMDYYEICCYCGKRIEKEEFYSIGLTTLTNSGKNIPVEGSRRIWKGAHKECFENSTLPEAEKETP